MRPSADPDSGSFGFRTVAPSAAAQDAQEPHEPPRHPGPKADAQQSGAPGLAQGQAQPKFPKAVRGQVPGTMTARLGPPPTSPVTCAMSIM
jgi:hypothetical protein